MNALDERLEGPAKRAGLQAVLGFEGLGPSEHPGGVVHVPDPDVGALQRKPHALFGGSQGLGALAKLLLSPFTLRDVLLDSDEVADVALQVPHRRDGLFLCVKTVVFAAIDHFAAPDVPGQNRVPQILVEHLIMLIRLDQVPWILTHGFCGAYSRSVLKMPD